MSVMTFICRQQQFDCFSTACSVSQERKHKSPAVSWIPLTKGQGCGNVSLSARHHGDAVTEHVNRHKFHHRGLVTHICWYTYHDRPRLCTVSTILYSLCMLVMYILPHPQSFLMSLWQWYLYTNVVEVTLMNMDIWTPYVHYELNRTARNAIVGNKMVDHSDVAGAPPVGAAPTTSSLSV